MPAIRRVPAAVTYRCPGRSELSIIENPWDPTGPVRYARRRPRTRLQWAPDQPFPLTPRNPGALRSCLLSVSDVTCHGVCPPWLGVFDNPSSLFAMLIDGCHEVPSVPGRAGLHGAGNPRLKLAHTTDEQPLVVGNRRSWLIMALFHSTDLDGCWLTVATYCCSSHFCGEKAVELFLYRISAHWQSPNISKWRVSHRRHWSMQRVFSVCLALH